MRKGALAMRSEDRARGSRMLEILSDLLNNSILVSFALGRVSWWEKDQVLESDSSGFKAEERLACRVNTWRLGARAVDHL